MMVFIATVIATIVIVTIAVPAKKLIDSIGDATPNARFAQSVITAFVLIGSVVAIATSFAFIA